MVSSHEFAPAVLFCVLYAALFGVLSWLFFKKEVKWKSRYLFVYIHVILRMAGMGCGIAFACMDWSDARVRGE